MSVVIEVLSHSYGASLVKIDGRMYALIAGSVSGTKVFRVPKELNMVSIGYRIGELVMANKDDMEFKYQCECVTSHLGVSLYECKYTEIEKGASFGHILSFLCDESAVPEPVEL